jgi:hypothetical protein
MKPIGGIRHALAVERPEILIDDQQIAFGDLVEAVSEGLRVERVWVFGAARNLAREAGVVAAVEQDAACERQLLSRRSRVFRQFGVHPRKRARDDLRFR